MDMAEDMLVATPNDERIAALDEADQILFWSKVDVGGPYACWPWTAGRSGNGYGAWSRGTGGVLIAHRAAYILRNGSIPQGYTVDHLCRNRLCCNPRHLDAVTVAENTRRVMRATRPVDAGRSLKDASIQERVTASGVTRYKVRFRIGGGPGQCRSRTFATRESAERAVREIKTIGAEAWLAREA
jgi:hypothetical protein